MARLRVLTENSMYFVDEDKHYLMRIPLEAEAPELRLDNQEIYLHRVERLEVGQIGMFVLGGLSPEAALTLRLTSTVTGIEEMT